jgi:hypothetical protein
MESWYAESLSWVRQTSYLFVLDLVALGKMFCLPCGQKWLLRLYLGWIYIWYSWSDCHFDSCSMFCRLLAIWPCLQIRHSRGSEQISKMCQHIFAIKFQTKCSGDQRATNLISPQSPRKERYNSPDNIHTNSNGNVFASSSIEIFLSFFYFFYYYWKL